MIYHANQWASKFDLVYHAPTCKALRDVVWVDDSTHRWASIARTTNGILISDGEIAVNEHQAKKILVMVDKRLIIIDPVDDQEMGDIRSDRVVPVKMIGVRSIEPVKGPK